MQGTPSPKNNPDDAAKKIKLIVIGVVITVIIVVVGISVTSNKGEEAPKDPEIVDKVDEEEGDSESTPDKKDEEKPEEEEKDLTVDDVRDDNILKPNDSLSEEDSREPQENVGSALDYLEELPEGAPFDPLASKGLNKTPSHVLDNIRYALALGYKFNFDEMEWFASTRANVYQFILPMSMEGDENIILTGNYINTTKEINISKIQGSPKSTDLISPDDVPQDGS